MKANELRIGNYFKFGELIHTATHWDIRNLAVDELKCKNSDTYQSILLTEEWLLRFGFEKVGVNYQKGWLILWTYLKTGEVHFVLNEPNSNKIHITELKYVHQLQNLYFALTGEELVEKP